MNSAAKVSASDVLGNAEWLPLRLSPDFNLIRFVHLSRADHSRLKYLEEKFLPAGTPSMDIAVAEIERMAVDVPAGPVRYIFHSSMCGSTLLARVLDQPDYSMALSEPIILNQLSARVSRGEDVTALLALVVRLLSRPFGDGEQTVVKPGNSANNLMPLIASNFPDLRALTLEASVQQLLRAVVKRGPQGRMIYRRLYAFVTRTRHLDLGMSPEDLWELTDLQVAALAWFAQHCEFLDMLTTNSTHFRSLTMDRLLSDRVETLTALGQFFGAGWDPRQVASDPRFSRHSKDSSRAYDDSQRRRDADEIDAIYGDETHGAAQWLGHVAERARIPLILPEPLVS